MAIGKRMLNTPVTTSILGDAFLSTFFPLYICSAAAQHVRSYCWSALFYGLHSLSRTVLFLNLENLHTFYITLHGDARKYIFRLFEKLVDLTCPFSQGFSYLMILFTKT